MKIGARVMLTIKIDMQEYLINRQVGEAAHIKAQ